MCVSALRTLGGTALSSYAAIVLWKLSFCSAGMQRTSMSERMQLDERKDDDEGGALWVLSALSPGLFAWRKDYHLNEMCEPGVKAWHLKKKGKKRKQGHELQDWVIALVFHCLLKSKTSSGWSKSTPEEMKKCPERRFSY